MKRIIIIYHRLYKRSYKVNNSGSFEPVVQLPKILTTREKIYLNNIVGNVNNKSSSSDYFKQPIYDSFSSMYLTAEPQHTPRSLLNRNVQLMKDKVSLNISF
jgi:hypothetical protein